MSGRRRQAAEQVRGDEGARLFAVAETGEKINSQHGAGGNEQAAAKGYGFPRPFVRKADIPHEVDGKRNGNSYPGAHKGFIRHEFPAHRQVGDGEELQRQRNFDKTEGDLHPVHPAAGFGQGVQPARARCKQRKRQGQRYRKPNIPSNGPRGTRPKSVGPPPVAPPAGCR